MDVSATENICTKFLSCLSMVWKTFLLLPNVIYIKIHSPTSNSKPSSMKLCMHPPAWSCCSSTKTFCPERARMLAVARPPPPLPITIVSKSAGTCFSANPIKNALNRSQMSQNRSSVSLILT